MMQGPLSYSINETLRNEIESRIRQYGSQLVTKQFTCSLQYFYQQISPVSNPNLNRDVPVFTLVEIAGNKHYIVSEGIDLTSDTNFPLKNLPIKTIDICEIENPNVFEKMNLFTPKSKNSKRIKFFFSKYIIDETNVVLLGEHCIMFPEGLSETAKSVVFGNHMHSAKSLNLNAGFVRPKNLPQLQLPLWIYQLAKISQRVFPVEEIPNQTIEFSDCVFAKDLFLV
jgi:hypothetical protein